MIASMYIIPREFCRLTTRAPHASLFANFDVCAHLAGAYQRSISIKQTPTACGYQTLGGFSKSFRGNAKAVIQCRRLMMKLLTLNGQQLPLDHFRSRGGWHVLAAIVITSNHVVGITASGQNNLPRDWSIRAR